MIEPESSRRDFLAGRALRHQLEAAGSELADAVTSGTPPSRGPSLLLRTAAMATDFDVVLNVGGPDQQLVAASEALEHVHRLETLMTVYRPDSELSRVNRDAATGGTTVDAELFQLLRRADRLALQTGGAFNAVSGALIHLWRDARRDDRIPTASEIAATLPLVDRTCVHFDDDRSAIAFDRPGMGFNLGAIGKGYAVDVAGEVLDAAGVENWLVHGGKSSVRARGRHQEHAGWPVGLQNPLLPDRPYLTLMLRDAALSTSGTSVQWFRHAGKRFGHILDPRTGWPVETMLSVSVIAPDAALSDALSTAFYVLGVENALQECDNYPDVGVIFFPLPEDGRTLRPVIHRIPPDQIYLATPDPEGIG